MPVDRTDAGRFAEVYPAAALKRWGLRPDSCKSTDHAPLALLLEQNCAALPALHLSAEDADDCRGVDRLGLPSSALHQGPESPVPGH